MPKEAIHPKSSDGFRIEVGWRRDCDVQVGIIIPEERVNEFMQPPFDSLWADLDRHQINRLIRVLRKARDEAYGRDE